MNPSLLIAFISLGLGSVLSWPLYPKCSISPVRAVEYIIGIYMGELQRINKLSATVSIPLPTQLTPGNHTINFFTDLPVVQFIFSSWPGLHHGSESGLEHGSDPRLEHGLEPRLDYGLEPGQQQQQQPGLADSVSVSSGGVGFDFTMPFTTNLMLETGSIETVAFEMLWTNLFGQPKFSSIYIDGSPACFGGNVIQLD